MKLVTVHFYLQKVKGIWKKKIVRRKNLNLQKNQGEMTFLPKNP